MRVPLGWPGAKDSVSLGDLVLRQSDPFKRPFKRPMHPGRKSARAELGVGAPRGFVKPVKVTET